MAWSGNRRTAAISVALLGMFSITAVGFQPAVNVSQQWHLKVEAAILTASRAIGVPESTARTPLSRTEFSVTTGADGHPAALKSSEDQQICGPDATEAVRGACDTYDALVGLGRLILTKVPQGALDVDRKALVAIGASCFKEPATFQCDGRRECTSQSLNASVRFTVDDAHTLGFEALCEERRTNSDFGAVVTVTNRVTGTFVRQDAQQRQ